MFYIHDNWLRRKPACKFLNVKSVTMSVISHVFKIGEELKILFHQAQGIKPWFIYTNEPRLKGSLLKVSTSFMFNGCM